MSEEVFDPSNVDAQMEQEIQAYEEGGFVKCARCHEPVNERRAYIGDYGKYFHKGCWLGLAMGPLLKKGETPSFDLNENPALYGILGEITRLIAPTYEADPVFILATLLTSCGAAVGHQPYTLSGRIPQHTNLFTVLVGDTASGKGGSWYAASSILKDAWAGIKQYAPPKKKPQKEWKDKTVPEYLDPVEVSSIVSGFGSGEVFVDTAEEFSTRDQPMLVRETEFVRPLKMARRDGSILAQVLNDAYDGGEMQSRSRMAGTKIVPEGHHICTVGHITPTELTETLSSLDAANGVGNRSMYIYGKSTQDIPFDIPIDEARMHRLLYKLKEILTNATQRSLVPIDEDAREYYTMLYSELKNDNPGEGLAGPLIQRGRVHHLRMSLIYALLDESPTIQIKHMHAAYSLWLHARSSVIYLWPPKSQPAESGRGQGVQNTISKVRDIVKDAKSITKGNLTKGLSHNHEKRLNEALQALTEDDEITVVDNGPGKAIMITWIGA